jgi:protein-S-isoprenylcysteine O-methyltransferase Ste14
MSDAPSRQPWWKGSRGEWYVVVQVLLFGLVVFGPRTFPGLPTWQAPWTWIASIVGGVLIVAGGVLSTAGVLRLGVDLSVLPAPKDGASFVQTGAYAIVRHPIYAGLIAAAFGYGLVVHGGLTLVYAAILFVFFDVKSRLEEHWLAEKFPDYGDYQRRVRKLMPWVY